jgi:hypothetical protein
MRILLLWYLLIPSLIVVQGQTVPNSSKSKLIQLKDVIAPIDQYRFISIEL